MSNYNVVTNWVGLDSLLDTDPNKVISGSTFETEFTTIQTALNTKQDSLSIIDDETFANPSSTAVASTASIKEYVDEADAYMSRASKRVCLWKGSAAPAALTTLFSPPASDRQAYYITNAMIKDSFDITKGKFLDIRLEYECVVNENGFVVGDVVSIPMNDAQGSNVTWTVWASTGGDLSSGVINFRVGDFGDDNKSFHVWTRADGVSTDTWQTEANWALYARISHILD